MPQLPTITLRAAAEHQTLLRKLNKRIREDAPFRNELEQMLGEKTRDWYGDLEDAVEDLKRRMTKVEDKLGLVA